jgi:TonB family protein
MKNRATILFAVVFLIAAFSLAKSKSFAWIQPQTDKEPELISTIAPAIPRLAARLGIRTNVVIELQINSSGTVNSAQFIAGHPLLQRTALDACLQWKFSTSEALLRTIRVTLVYPKPSWDESTRVLILPYQIELQANLEPPSDTVSYIPQDFKAGRNRCKVHGTALEKDKVKIIYGLMGFKAGYPEANRRLFPHSNIVDYGGGCVIKSDNPKYAEILYCRRCRKAEAKWSKAHRKEKRYS